MRLALDTNILAYAEGVGDADRRDRTVELLEHLPQDCVLIPVQVLGELHRVLTGKTRRTPDQVRTIILQWADSYEIVDSCWPAFQAAFDLTVDHGLQTWDALILAVTAENHCRLLLSEDLQHGFTWRGVTVINPYQVPTHPLLASFINTKSKKKKGS